MTWGFLFLLAAEVAMLLSGMALAEGQGALWLISGALGLGLGVAGAAWLMRWVMHREAFLWRLERDVRERETAAKLRETLRGR